MQLTYEETNPDDMQYEEPTDQSLYDDAIEDPNIRQYMATVERCNKLAIVAAEGAIPEKTRKDIGFDFMTDVTIVNLNNSIIDLKRDARDNLADPKYQTLFHRIQGIKPMQELSPETDKSFIELQNEIQDIKTQLNELSSPSTGLDQVSTKMFESLNKVERDLYCYKGCTISKTILYIPQFNEFRGRPHKDRLMTLKDEMLNHYTSNIITQATAIYGSVNMVCENATTHPQVIMSPDVYLVVAINLLILQEFLIMYSNKNIADMLEVRFMKQQHADADHRDADLEQQYADADPRADFKKLLIEAFSKCYIIFLLLGYNPTLNFLDHILLSRAQGITLIRDRISMASWTKLVTKNRDNPLLLSLLKIEMGVTISHNIEQIKKKIFENNNLIIIAKNYDLEYCAPFLDQAVLYGDSRISLTIPTGDTIEIKDAICLLGCLVASKALNTVFSHLESVQRTYIHTNQIGQVQRTERTDKMDSPHPYKKDKKNKKKQPRVMQRTITHHPRDQEDSVAPFNIFNLNDLLFHTSKSMGLLSSGFRSIRRFFSNSTGGSEVPNIGLGRRVSKRHKKHKTKRHKKHKTKRHKRHKKRPTKRHKRRKSNKKHTTKHH